MHDSTKKFYETKFFLDKKESSVKSCSEFFFQNSHENINAGVSF